MQPFPNFASNAHTFGPTLVSPFRWRISAFQCVRRPAPIHPCSVKSVALTSAISPSLFGLPCLPNQVRESMNQLMLILTFVSLCPRASIRVPVFPLQFLCHLVVEMAMSTFSFTPFDGRKEKENVSSWHLHLVELLLWKGIKKKISPKLFNEYCKIPIFFWYSYNFGFIPQIVYIIFINYFLQLGLYPCEMITCYFFYSFFLELFLSWTF